MKASASVTPKGSDGWRNHCNQGPRRPRVHVAGGTAGNTMMFICWCLIPGVCGAWQRVEDDAHKYGLGGGAADPDESVVGHSSYLFLSILVALGCYASLGGGGRSARDQLPRQSVRNSRRADSGRRRRMRNRDVAASRHGHRRRAGMQVWLAAILAIALVVGMNTAVVADGPKCRGIGAVLHARELPRAVRQSLDPPPKDGMRAEPTVMDDRSIQHAYDPQRATPPSCTVQLGWLCEVTFGFGCRVQKRRCREEGDLNTEPLDHDAQTDHNFEATSGGGCCCWSRCHWFGSEVHCGGGVRVGDPVTDIAVSNAIHFSGVPGNGNGSSERGLAVDWVYKHYRHTFCSQSRGARRFGAWAYGVTEGDYLRGKSVRESLKGKSLYAAHGIRGKDAGSIARRPRFQVGPRQDAQVLCGSSWGRRSGQVMNGSDAYAGPPRLSDWSSHRACDPQRATPSSCTVQLDWLCEVTSGFGCRVQMRRCREEGAPSTAPLDRDAQTDRSFEAASGGGWCCWSRCHRCGSEAGCSGGVRVGVPVTVCAGNSNTIHLGAALCYAIGFSECSLRRFGAWVYGVTEGDYLRGKSVGELLKGKLLYATHGIRCSNADSAARRPRIQTGPGHDAWFLFSRASPWSLVVHIWRSENDAIDKRHQGWRQSVAFISAARWIGRARFPQPRRKGHSAESAQLGQLRIQGRTRSVILRGLDQATDDMDQGKHGRSAARTEAWTAENCQYNGLSMVFPGSGSGYEGHDHLPATLAAAHRSGRSRCPRSHDKGPSGELAGRPVRNGAQSSAQDVLPSGPVSVIILIGRTTLWSLSAHCLRDGDGTMDRRHHALHLPAVGPSAHCAGRPLRPGPRGRGSSEEPTNRVAHSHDQCSDQPVLLSDRGPIIAGEGQDGCSSVRAENGPCNSYHFVSSESRGAIGKYGRGRANTHCTNQRPDCDDLNRDVNDRVGSMGKGDSGRNEGRDGPGQPPLSHPALRHSTDDRVREASPQEVVWHGDGDPTQEGMNQEKAAVGPVSPQKNGTSAAHKGEGDTGGGVSANECTTFYRDITIDDGSGDGSEHDEGDGAEDGCDADDGADDVDDVGSDEVSGGCRPPPPPRPTLPAPPLRTRTDGRMGGSTRREERVQAAMRARSRGAKDPRQAPTAATLTKTLRVPMVDGMVDRAMAAYPVSVHTAARGKMMNATVANLGNDAVA